MKVKELIAKLSALQDQNATVWFDEGAVFLEVGDVKVIEGFNKYGAKCDITTLV